MLADSSNLGLRPFYGWARLKLPWTLVAGATTNPGQVQQFREAGIHVEVAEVAPTG